MNDTCGDDADRARRYATTIRATTANPALKRRAKLMLTLRVSKATALPVSHTHHRMKTFREESANSQAARLTVATSSARTPGGHSARVFLTTRVVPLANDPAMERDRSGTCRRHRWLPRACRSRSDL
ncbi:MAG TPA: hypothetical protein VGJ37_09330 [Pyrinomonadaceae bacterium]